MQGYFLVTNSENNFPFLVYVGPGKEQCMKAQQEDIDAITECRNIKPD